MTLTSSELEYLASTACKAARSAGALVLASRPAVVRLKAEGTSEASRVVTEIDLKSQDLILGALQESVDKFSLGVLSEERDDDGGRLSQEYFWAIDPLDGTLPYIEASPGFAISIALVSRLGVPELGVVFDPTEDSLYCAIRGQGITRNGRGWTRPDGRAGTSLSIFSDRSFTATPNYAQLLDALNSLSLELGGSEASVSLGSGAVINACHVLNEPPACYFKFPKSEAGGGAIWDFAATACLFREAGAVATDIEGQALQLNRADSTWMNHRGVLFATSATLAERIQALHKRHP